MYVTGIGRTKFGTLTETMPELIYQAMYNAINDSPVSIEDDRCRICEQFYWRPIRETAAFELSSIQSASRA